MTALDMDRMPVLVGVGQVTVRDEPLDALSSPLDLMEQAAGLAAADAGLDPSALADLDELVVVRSFREPTGDTPASLARRLGAANARTWLTPDGGQAPQYLVNRYFDRITRGENSFVLLAGAEAMDNARRLIKSGGKPDWREPEPGPAELIYPDRDMVNAHEKAHGIWLASLVYPLFENALRHHYGRTIAEHQQAMGALFAPFTEIAATSPHAWFPVARSATEIATPGPKNRFVGWPYTKFMNAMNQINQSAALLLTSVGEARRRGIPDSRLLYLHGAADTVERWHITDRVNYFGSPALKVMARELFRMAGCGTGDINLVDIYSCFPSAVQVARDALGISADDPRPLTVTGGLPFHGGAGNNYSMNAIATMADRLRDRPGARGVVTANGGYLGKHSGGIYSTEPPRHLSDGSVVWSRPAPATYQAEIDAMSAPPFTATPDGAAEIETWTVAYGRDGEPTLGIVVGRLGAHDDPAATRFIANTRNEPEILKAMTERDLVGARGRVTAGRTNLFEF